MGKLLKAWFIITLITFIIFKLGETMTTVYSGPAGEGNPYVLVLLVGWPFVLLFIWITVRLTRRTVASVHGLTRVFLIVGSTLMAGIGSYVNLGQASSLQEGIRASDNAAYASGWNQFTNIIYANQLTFFVLMVSCMAVGIVLSFVASNKREEQL